ncbi:2-octaprenyl-6-methoxyphenyl hydroxylase [Sinimarinibacterium sp. CAU 1509]|nr:2-octaprenyl-6-methoxyphenyl hydroxylase [Sinimarinibacterium sp. CAU 1509]
MFDVAIVGGGLVGASLAVGLSGRQRVALIEAAPPPVGEARWDERCIAVNHASVCILESLGVWADLRAEAAPITSTHISEQGRFGVARFAAAEAGLDALGYNVPIRALGSALWQRMLALGTTTLLCPARLQSLVRSDDAVELALDDGRIVRARLVVAADGMNSPVRELLGIDAERRDYGQSAIVTAVQTTRTHAGCAYERFTPGGPIALLPKWPQGGDRICSLVWTTPREQLRERIDCSDDDFIAAAQAAFGERLGRFSGLGARQAWPLMRVMSERLTAPRVLFAGNAAQSLHPVAAQGFNLGLRDVATVAELLNDPAFVDSDPGADAVLAEYAQRRQRDRARVADFTDQLVRLFSNRIPGLRGLRHLGLLALDLAPGVREAVLWQNLGFGGRAPQAARTPA